MDPLAQEVAGYLNAHVIAKQTVSIQTRNSPLLRDFTLLRIEQLCGACGHFVILVKNESVTSKGFIDCHHFALTELGIERRDGNESVFSHLDDDPILILIGHGGRSKKRAPKPIAHFVRQILM